MKKILNAPSAYVDEMLAGVCAAYPTSYRLAGEKGTGARRRDRTG